MGSIFTTTLCETIKKNPQYELNSLLLDVKNQLKKEKNMFVYLARLTKNLYLTPGKSSLEDSWNSVSIKNEPLTPLKTSILKNSPFNQDEDDQLKFSNQHKILNTPPSNSSSKSFYLQPSFDQDLAVQSNSASKLTSNFTNKISNQVKLFHFLPFNGLSSISNLNPHKKTTFSNISSTSKILFKIFYL